MLYTRQQAAEYLKVSPYSLLRMINDGRLVPANLDHVVEAKSKGTRAVYKFSMEEMRRCKKVREEEEQQKEAERKAQEEALRIQAKQRTSRKANGVPVSLSGVSMMSTIDVSEVKTRLQTIEHQVNEIRQMVEQIHKALM